mmetsp:Transcript_23344/g.51052  ORF Transcript_23344/g.51052 Transcript_23344/m.51052 type:complete len:129 (-) Transcript_23344:166-552(-)
MPLTLCQVLLYNTRIRNSERQDSDLFLLYLRLADISRALVRDCDPGVLNTLQNRFRQNPIVLCPEGCQSLFSRVALFPELLHLFSLEALERLVLFCKLFDFYMLEALELGALPRKPFNLLLKGPHSRR